jgi:hypothetical protein
MQDKVTGKTQPSAGDAPRDMFTPSQIRALKFAVVGMGVLLLAGFALVIGRIVYLTNRAPPLERPPAATASQPSAKPLALPPGAVVRHLSMSDSRLAVHFEGPGGSGIRILDLAQGTWSEIIPITHEPPSRSRP